MKKFFLVNFVLLLATTCPCQDGKWMIKINGKPLLITSTEDKAANTKIIKSSVWRKSGYLELIYTESEPNAWKRSFQLVDENDNQLLSRDSTTKIKIPLYQLRKIFAGKKELTIYTVVAPANPDIMIRIRRVHLCTMKLP
jgi:hypothetical protein